MHKPGHLPSALQEVMQPPEKDSRMMPLVVQGE